MTSIIRSRSWNVQLNNIYAKGRQAFVEGKAKLDCPYGAAVRGVQGQRRLAWVQGWQSASHERAQQLLAAADKPATPEPPAPEPPPNCGTFSISRLHGGSLIETNQLPVVEVVLRLHGRSQHMVKIRMTVSDLAEALVGNRVVPCAYELRNLEEKTDEVPQPAPDTPARPADLPGRGPGSAPGPAPGPEAAPPAGS